MITFKDVRQEKKLTYFLVPGCIHGDMSHWMETEIPVTKVYTSTQVLRKKVPEMAQISQSDIDDAKTFFKNNGFRNLHAMSLIVLHSNIGDLRQKALLFHGDTMAPDLKAEREEEDVKSKDYNKKLLASYSDKYN